MRKPKGFLREGTERFLSLYKNTHLPPLEKRTYMITQEQVTQWANAFLAPTDYVLQTVQMLPDNNILVEIDRLGSVDVDVCAALNQYLAEQLGDEDYAIEVGSVSLTAPFQSRLQYEKHLGHNVVFFTTEGKKMHGQLVSVDEESFAVDIEQTVAVEGKKRKLKQTVTLTLPYNGVKEIKYDLKI